MSEFRRVESRLTLPLENRNFSVFEGSSSAIRASLDRLDRNDERIASQLEIIDELRDSRRVGEAVYSLVKRQELAALASISIQAGPVADADRRLLYTVISNELALRDEVEFLESVHRDLRDGLRPPVRRYEGGVWAAIDPMNLFERDIYERVYYQQDHAIPERVYYVRRT